MEDSFLLQIKVKIEISNVYSSERNLKGNKEMTKLSKITFVPFVFGCGVGSMLSAHLSWVGPSHLVFESQQKYMQG